MGEIRARLLQSGLSAEEAQALAANVKINKSALKAATEEELRQDLADFFQITGGKGAGKLKTLKLDDERAYADDIAGAINIGKNATAVERRKVLYHELGHFAEFEDQQAQQQYQAWVKARATGPEFKLNTIIPGLDDDEVGVPDLFHDPYVGKLYEDGSTEVLSTAMEHFTDAERMLKLYKQDREHFLLTLGGLRRR